MKKIFKIFLFIAMLFTITFVINKKSINASTDLSVGANIRNSTITFSTTFDFPNDGAGTTVLLKFENNTTDVIYGIGSGEIGMDGEIQCNGFFSILAPSSQATNLTNVTITIPDDKDYIISELNYVTGTYEEPVGCPHDWILATCTNPKTCSICGQTEGEPLGHTWEEATKYTPKTCSTCGQKEGNLLPFNDNQSQCALLYWFIC